MSVTIVSNLRRFFLVNRMLVNLSERHSIDSFANTRRCFVALEIIVFYAKPARLVLDVVLINVVYAYVLHWQLLDSQPAKTA